jgi:hypothetical protein
MDFIHYLIEQKHSEKPKYSLYMCYRNINKGQ